MIGLGRNSWFGMSKQHLHQFYDRALPEISPIFSKVPFCDQCTSSMPSKKQAAPWLHQKGAYTSGLRWGKVQLPSWKSSYHSMVKLAPVSELLNPMASCMICCEPNRDIILALVVWKGVQLCFYQYRRRVHFHFNSLTIFNYPSMPDVTSSTATQQNPYLNFREHY